MTTCPKCGSSKISGPYYIPAPHHFASDVPPSGCADEIVAGDNPATAGLAGTAPTSPAVPACKREDGCKLTHNQCQEVGYCIYGADGHAPVAGGLPEEPVNFSASDFDSVEQVVSRVEYDTLRTHAAALQERVAGLERERCHHGWRGTVPDEGQKIVTRCPACGCQSLFIGSGGHLTCARVPGGGSDGCNNPSVENAVEQLKRDLDAARALLRVAKCPACDGSGSILRQVGDHECEAEQCQWCFEAAALHASREDKGSKG